MTRVEYRCTIICSIHIKHIHMLYSTGRRFTKKRNCDEV